jgi:plastocyanin
MSDIWDTLVNDYLARLVSPDWGGLIALIPVALLGLVGVYMLWVVRRFAMAGPKTRGGPVTPTTPAGVHMPGPSLSPLLMAGAASVLFLGLAFMNVPDTVFILDTVPVSQLGPYVFGLGVVLVIGAGLYWGRESMRDYDRTDGRGIPPAPEHAGPPAGVHVPGPSFRPLLIAVAASVLFLGLALTRQLGASLLIAGLVMFVIVGLQWLRDAVVEYRLTVRADATGHLENPPAPHFPWATLTLFAILAIVAVLIGSGAFPPGSGGTPAATAAPGGGGGTASTPPSAASSAAASGAPTTSGAPSGTVLAVAAQNIAFDVAELTAPADTPFQIAFANNDAGIPHNVAIHRGSATGEVVFQGDIITGVASTTYDVPALPAGTYAFVCTVHPNMVGTLTVK